MRPLTRRQLLALGLAGAGMTAAGGAGLWWSSTWGTFGGAGEDLIQPPVLTARDGALELTLKAAPARLRIGNRTANVQAFNGSLPGPTLRVRPGDTLRVRMVNQLEAPTNLHVHGLHVSPQANGDNPFVSITAGGSFDYEYRIPEDHPAGTYWYHPHHHGHVADQIAAGLYGTILVEDPDPVPVTRERVLVVSDLSLDPDGNLSDVTPMGQIMGREGQIVLVNGQLRPRLVASAGERERWRIVNACPSRFLRLQLEGQTVRLLGRDVGRLPEPMDVTEIELAPGNRADLIVETREGITQLVAAPVDRGSMAGMMGPMTGPLMGEDRPGAEEPVELLTLDVSGDPAAGPLAPIPEWDRLRDLRGDPIAARRTLAFAMGMGGVMVGGGGDSAAMMSFTVNGRTFDPDRLDETVAAGAVEEWTLSNSSPMDHPIHLHVWPMQVVEDGDRDLTEPLWLDVVNVPARSQVKVLVAFDDFRGRTVFHCHILDHEDLGMMGTIEAR
ncbi:multicopper oxidase family protein [Kocuria aegyptia]|uniref:Multicopper oxidase family protein n=1 Tax=Kocuria aegyptia TaxID=330943 RepID=A0ABN2K8Z5_9MICC